MDSKTSNQISKFINELKSFFPNLITRTEECSYDDGVIIWHNCDEVNNVEFSNVTAKLFDKYFREDGFFDVGVSYDFELDISQ